MSPRSRLTLLLALLALAAAAVALGALFIGSAAVSARAVIAVLAGRGGGTGVADVVVLSLRLPRILAALLAGGALAVAGVGFQALTRNPLAEPSVLGVSSGAAFGVITAQVFGLRAGVLEALGLTAFAFCGALVAGIAVYTIASHAGGLPVHTLVLAGVIVGVFFSSAITVLISVVDFDRLGGVIHWRPSPRRRSPSSPRWPGSASGSCSASRASSICSRSARKGPCSWASMPSA